MVTKKAGASGDYDFFFGMSGNDYKFGAGSDPFAVATGAIVAGFNGIDTHVVARSKGTGGSDSTIWVNGEQEASGANTIEATTTREFTLGGYHSAFAMDGSIWHIGIWNLALSDAEILYLHHPATRYDLIWQPRVQIQGFVAAAPGGATPKGPLGMPLHGPFGGPIG